MIYTCTFNPSLDYYLEFDSPIEIGKTNRSELEYYEAGGKGVNVSILLSNLMIPSRAFGFLGGFTSDFYLSLLQRYEYLQPSFTFVEGHTRINIKIKGESETEFNAQGPVITDSNFDTLLKRVERLDHNDIFVLSGNVQENLRDNVEKMIKMLSENEVRFVLDTNPDMIKRLLKYHPLLIKPNISELELICKHPILSENEIISHAKELVNLGALNVIVSLGDEGSIMVNLDGAYKANAVHDDVISTTGAGDSMVAGFVFNMQRGSGVINAFKYANCCGCATSFSKGLATRDKIEKYYDLINVEKID